MHSKCVLVLVALGACCSLSLAQRFPIHRESEIPAENRMVEKETQSTSWWNMISCFVNQIPTLPSDFNKPLYKYMFETFARNTHLLPFVVPTYSSSEDFESTAKFEKCLWGKAATRDTGVAKGESKDGASSENELDSSSAYHQLFDSRQGGYDSFTGFSLLGGKMVAALAGYVVFALMNAT